MTRQSQSVFFRGRCALCEGLPQLLAPAVILPVAIAWLVVGSLSLAADAPREPVALDVSAAAAPSVRIVEVRAGLGGRFKVGYWAPLEVTL